jgi:hypothetical protein
VRNYATAAAVSLSAVRRLGSALHRIVCLSDFGFRLTATVELFRPLSEGSVVGGRGAVLYLGAECLGNFPD